MVSKKIEYALEDNEGPDHPGHIYKSPNFEDVPKQKFRGLLFSLCIVFLPAVLIYAC